MGRVFRFIKFSFFIGGVASGLALFTSMDLPMNIKDMKEMAMSGMQMPSQGEVQLTEEDLAGLSNNQRQELELASQQAQIKESEQRRAEKAIVRHKEVDYVLINGKYYRYNPDNIYLINGVKTFYKPGGYDKMRDKRAKAAQNRLRMAHSKSSSKLLKNANSLTANSMKGYSREGIQQMQETLKELQRNALMRNKMLENMGN